LELHKPLQAAFSGASLSRRSSAVSDQNSSAAAANLDDLNAMATKAGDAATSAIDDANGVARRASTYLKAAMGALIVQKKAELADAKADKVRALVEDAAVNNAKYQQRGFRTLC
jgi:hypothetical protein